MASSNKITPESFLVCDAQIMHIQIIFCTFIREWNGYCTQFICGFSRFEKLRPYNKERF